MLRARRRILMIGWDFDARIALTNQDRLPGEPGALGGFIPWLVRRTPSLEVYVLRWDKGVLKTLLRGPTAFTVMRWMANRRIHTKLDSFHPTAASHHQKIVVIDNSVAFSGGIDMTGDRWDTRLHLDDEPGRVDPAGRPYKPWHDAVMAVDGAAAAAIAELAEERWHAANGRPIPLLEGGADCWPDGLAPDIEAVDIDIARTRAAMPGYPEVHEVEAQFLAQIAEARRFLYIESQYVASRRIAEAIARRLDEPDGPEIVIVNPEKAQGWLEPLAMDTARARLMEALARRDKHGRLRLYHPYTAAGQAIYCHAKILITDDRVVRVGSANLNNRSMRLDTECDLTIDAERPGNGHAAALAQTVRDGLLAEHLGETPARVGAKLAETGSLIATIEALRGPGRSLRPYQPPTLSAAEKWLADGEVLDPEGPDEMFEPLSRRGLFRRLRRP
ncbi:phospholipase [Sphingomonas sp. XMGL2]|uniref:Phospholipase D n=2 Tax=Sphingomonas quercus TaxID=2842451 RepID=A0ABS6BMG2_9SPHN|nr:phospholipase [Sphingomonas quercus]